MGHVVNGGPMKQVANISSHLKKIYRQLNLELLRDLEERGFTDLRPSFLEVLTVLCEKNGPSIKEVGHFCGLKKQTMTGHLNELEKRGYIVRRTGEKDKREQRVFLTEYGEKFKLNLNSATSALEGKLSEKVGSVELTRLELLLTQFYQNISKL